jgi:uncharacterized membrane protein YkoI
MILRPALTGCLALALAAPAAAQFGRNETRILTAQEAGRIAPFEKIAAALEGRSGVVTEIELEEEDDAPSGWVYEVEIVTAEGEVELELDARTGEVLDEDD